MIKPDFDIEAISRQMESDTTNVFQFVIDRYIQVLKEALNQARTLTRDQGGFGDYTGNLRSSICGGVFRDGVSVYIDSQPSEKGTDKATGVKTGLALLMQTAQEQNQGVVLILCVGMDYALTVESRGRDVITGSTLYLEQQLSQMLGR